MATYNSINAANRKATQILTSIMTESEFAYEIHELEQAYQMDISKGDQALHLLIANNIVDVTQDDEGNWMMGYKTRQILTGNH